MYYYWYREHGGQHLHPQNRGVQLSSSQRHCSLLVLGPWSQGDGELTSEGLTLLHRGGAKQPPFSGSILAILPLVDCVTRAGSAGTESGSCARFLVLLTMLAPVAAPRRREAHGFYLQEDQHPATARRPTTNRTPKSRTATVRHGQLSSLWRSSRRFANFQRQRAPAGPPNCTFRAVKTVSDQ